MESDEENIKTLYEVRWHHRDGGQRVRAKITCLGCKDVFRGYLQKKYENIKEVKKFCWMRKCYKDTIWKVEILNQRER